LTENCFVQPLGSHAVKKSTSKLIIESPNIPYLSTDIVCSQNNVFRSREADIEHWLRLYSVSAEKMYGIFPKEMQDYIEKGYIGDGYNKQLSDPAQVVYLLLCRLRRLEEVLLSLTNLWKASSSFVHAVLMIEPFYNYVRDGISNFMGTSHVNPQKLVDHYIKSRQDCLSKETVLTRARKKIRTEGVLKLSRGCKFQVLL